MILPHHWLLKQPSHMSANLERQWNGHNHRFTIQRIFADFSEQQKKYQIIRK